MLTAFDREYPPHSPSQTAPSISTANTIRSSDAGVTDVIREQWEWQRRGLQGMGFTIPTIAGIDFNQEYMGVPLWTIGIGGLALIVLPLMMGGKD